MGKIVKFCDVCEEGFAEKFAFCPNCGGSLKAFEMNPLPAAVPVVEAKPEAPVAQKFEAEPVSPVTPPAETIIESPTAIEPEPVEVSPQETQPKLDDEFLAEETAAFTAPASGNGYQNDYRVNSRAAVAQTATTTKNIDDGFHITIVEEKNTGTRNALLLGSWLLVTTLALGGVVYSLFDKELFAAEIGTNEMLSAVIVDDVPMAIEEEQPEPEKSNDDAGGGGGGGREEPDPVSKGRLAPQTPEKPLITPTKTIPQMDSELKMQAFTQGPERPVKVTNENYGDPNSTSFKLSDGTGRGGGQGSGVGTGQGSGVGTGAGLGRGSGMGSGVGNGIGGGRGAGVDNDSEPPPAKPVGPPTPLRIIAKPRANYTDAARQANIQGVVRLRVTFLANGSIGSITPVSGLGYGLTEQAIAAARAIKFEPQKRGGQAIATTKVVEYTFTLY